MQDQHGSTSKAMAQPPSDDGILIQRTPPSKSLIIASAVNQCFIDTIPNEMLEEISVLVVFSADKDKRAKAAMKLAHVNRRWRSFVMDASSLWIDITLTDICKTDVLDQILSLHRHKPLDLSLYYPDRISGNRALGFWKMLMVIVRHIAQCRVLHIETAASNFHQIQRIFSKNMSVPHLTHLSLICIDRDHKACPSFPVLDFHFERPPEIFVSGVIWENPVLSIARKVHLKGTDVAWSGTVQRVDRTSKLPPQLTVFYRDHSPPNQADIDISNLTDLKVEGDKAISMFLGYSSLFGNTVEILELTALSAYGWYQINDMFRGSTGGFKMVKRLTISNLPFNKMDFITPSSLEAFPALTVLEIVTPTDFIPSAAFMTHYNMLAAAVDCSIKYNGKEIPWDTAQESDMLMLSTLQLTDT